VVIRPGAAVEPDQVLRELRSFLEIWEGNNTLRTALKSPIVGRSARQRVIDRSVETTRVDEDHLQLSVGRIGSATSVRFATYRRCRGRVFEERQGIVRAELALAGPLTPEQEQLLRQALGRMVGKKVKLQPRISADVIGGVQIRIGSTVYDGSVRGQLEALRKRLLTARLPASEAPAEAQKATG
jgi:F-type H+-transporting ATPase subunit delta